MPRIIYELEEGRNLATLQELRDFLYQIAHLDGDIRVDMNAGYPRVIIDSADDPHYNKPVARDAKGRFTKQK